MKKKLLSSIFWCLLIVYIIINYPLIFNLARKFYLALDAKCTNIENMRTLLSAEAGFIGTILAIFFTLFILPIQNVLGKYSPVFFKIIARDRIYWTSFLFMSFSLILILIFLFWGSGNLVSFFTLIISIVNLIVLGILIRRTFYLIDVTNILPLVTGDVIRSMERIFIKYQTETKKGRASLMKKIGLSEDFASQIDKFKVDDKAIEEIKIKVVPLVSTLSRAIDDNQLEIVTKGLKEIEKIAIKYLDLREEYSTYDDRFISYINEQLIILSKLAKKSYNQRFLPDISDTVKNIGIKCLDLKPIRAEFGENSLVMPFSQLLKDICLSEEMFKETSYAPSAACLNLLSIGEECIKKGFSVTGIYDAGDKLFQISLTTIGVHHSFFGYISQTANYSLMKLLETCFTYFDNFKGNRDLLIRKITENIHKISEEYLKNPNPSQLTGFSPLAAFYGPLATLGISKVLGYGLTRDYTKERDLDDVLDVVDDCLMRLNWLLLSEVKDKTDRGNAYNLRQLIYRDIVDQIYALFFYYISVFNKKLNEHNEKKAREILHGRLILMLRNTIDIFVDIKDSHWIIESGFENYFSAIGVLFYETFREESNLDFNEELKKEVEKIIEIFSKKKIADQNRRDYIEFLKYLRLVGSWSIHFNFDEGVADKIAKVISYVEEVTQIKYDGTAYPLGEFEHLWIPKRPYLTIDMRYWENLDKSLQDEVAKAKFDEIINKRKSDKKKEETK